MQRARRQTGLSPTIKKHRRKLAPLDMARPHEVDWDAVKGIFESGRGLENACYVYVIGEAEDGPVKIGLSNNPVSRLRNMQIGNPRQLRIERVLIGDYRIEFLLHLLWEPFALRVPDAQKDLCRASVPSTEWFRSDARFLMLPTFAEAAAQQIEYMELRTDTVSLATLEGIVRRVHNAEGVKMPELDLPRRVARHMGYTQPRAAVARLLDGESAPS